MMWYTPMNPAIPSQNFEKCRESLLQIAEDSTNGPFTGLFFIFFVQACISTGVLEREIGFINKCYSDFKCDSEAITESRARFDIAMTGSKREIGWAKNDDAMILDSWNRQMKLHERYPKLQETKVRSDTHGTYAPILASMAIKEHDFEAALEHMRMWKLKVLGFSQHVGPIRFGMAHCESALSNPARALIKMLKHYEGTDTFQEVKTMLVQLRSFIIKCRFSVPLTLTPAVFDTY